MDNRELLLQLTTAKMREIRLLVIVLVCALMAIFAGVMHYSNKKVIDAMPKAISTEKVETKIDDSALFLKSVIETNAANTVFGVEDILGKKLGEERVAMKQAISALHCPKCKTGQERKTEIAKIPKKPAKGAKKAKKTRQHKGRIKKTPQIAKKAAKDEFEDLELVPFEYPAKDKPAANPNLEYMGVDKTGRKMYFNNKTGGIEIK